MRAAKAKGALVSLDLASFEVVRHCKATLVRILETGVVDLLFANEDEAELELTGAGRKRRQDGARAAEERAAGSGDPEELFSRADADVALTWMLRALRGRRRQSGREGVRGESRAGARGVAPGRARARRGHHRRWGLVHRRVLIRVPRGGVAPGVRELRMRGGDAGGAGARRGASRVACGAELAERTAEIMREGNSARAAETK